MIKKSYNLWDLRLVVKKISPSDVKYIKLGPGGKWEAECIDTGIIKFGYHETPNQLCIDGKWAEVHEIWKIIRGSKTGTATSDLNQIKVFYTAQEDTVFITFYGGFLYWCRPTGDVTVLQDGSRIRQTIDGWHNRSINGTIFTISSINGELNATHGFRGTICNVKKAEYVIRKINDDYSPEIIEFDLAETSYLNSIRQLCKLLTWQDFELLVDLIFSQSGWRRVGSLGKTQKTIDLVLELPTTRENALVQVKSIADNATLDEYVKKFHECDAYDRMFFVWHSGPLNEEQQIDGVTLIGPEKLSEIILESGLTRWLRKKVW